MNGAALIHGSAKVQDPTGLHARPAVKITKLAKRFTAKVDVRGGAGGEWANAKSPTAVMKLKARHGEILELRASGADAGAAVDALAALIDRNFAD